MNQEERIKELERQLAELKGVKDDSSAPGPSLKSIFFLYLAVIAVGLISYWGYREPLEGYIKAEGKSLGFGQFGPPNAVQGMLLRLHFLEPKFVDQKRTVRVFKCMLILQIKPIFLFGLLNLKSLSCLLRIIALFLTCR